MQTSHVLLLLVAGFATGFINVVAAGGSLISMPALILLGLPPATANGTNRIAILIQNATAVSRFRQQGFSDFRLSAGLSLATVPGAILGSFAAIAIDPVIFERLLGCVLLGALVLIFGGRKPEDAGLGRPHPVLAHFFAALAGLWGGFMQAGVGFIIMPILYYVLRLDLVRVNMHKVFIIGLYNIPVLFVFASRGHVWWLGGLVLAAGNAGGAWLGANATIRGGERLVRIVFAISVVAMAAKLLSQNSV